MSEVLDYNMKQVVTVMLETVHIAATHMCSIVFARWRLYVPHLVHGSLAHANKPYPPNSILIILVIFARLTV